MSWADGWVGQRGVEKAVARADLKALALVFSTVETWVLD